MRPTAMQLTAAALLLATGLALGGCSKSDAGAAPKPAAGQMSPDNPFAGMKQAIDASKAAGAKLAEHDQAAAAAAADAGR